MKYYKMITLKELNFSCICNISLVCFRFIFTPCSMCYGTANVSVILNEVPVPEIPPQSTAVTVTIEVLAVQNPPVIFVFDQNSYILLPDRTAPVEVSIWCIQGWI